MQKISFGRLGEKIAATFLKNKGFRIIEMNFHAHWGEIDIVAIDEDTLVFIEVKSRTENDGYTPEEAMTRWKINALKRTCLFYKTCHPRLPENLRIDFIGIMFDNDKKPLKINYVKNIDS